VPSVTDALALPRREDLVWQRGARCKGQDPALFVPDLGEVDEDTYYVPVPRDVQVLCALCPVQDECLSWAMNNDAYGFWAGTSRYERVAMRVRRHRARCPGCRSDVVATLGRTETCLACGISWPAP